MARYYPPRSFTTPFKTLVQKADPDYQRAIRNETEYTFSNGRTFTANPNTRGPYAPDED
jgi:hypothetical protein